MIERVTLINYISNISALCSDDLLEIYIVFSKKINYIFYKNQKLENTKFEINNRIFHSDAFE